VVVVEEEELQALLAEAEEGLEDIEQALLLQHLFINLIQLQ
jgi:hypothetical protein